MTFIRLKLTSALITLTSTSQIRKEFFVKQKFLHHCCTRNAFEVLQYKSFVNLLSWSSAFDFYKYDSKRAIFEVDYQIWKKNFLKLFQKFKVLMFFDERALKKNVNWSDDFWSNEKAKLNLESEITIFRVWIFEFEITNELT